MAKWKTTDFNNTRIKNEQREAKRQEILRLVKIACDKFGGLAEIGDGFYVFNTRDYKVEKIGDNDE